MNPGRKKLSPAVLEINIFRFWKSMSFMGSMKDIIYWQNLSASLYDNDFFFVAFTCWDVFKFIVVTIVSINNFLKIKNFYGKVNIFNLLYSIKPNHLLLCNVHFATPFFAHRIVATKKSPIQKQQKSSPLAFNSARKLLSDFLLLAAFRVIFSPKKKEKPFFFRKPRFSWKIYAFHPFSTAETFLLLNYGSCKFGFSALGAIILRKVKNKITLICILM